MIETTREAPENIGTALKTIIARFQEMKKDPALTEPVEGEIVNVNKTEAALRSVGIALRDQAGEFRNFDDVILDISAKWDTMTMMQQRYVATTAAGSRQQSRFIALVQNNARLLKLTGDAANSAGSAQTQFGKTLDSLQSKLNKLSNALDLLWTNLFDNALIKLAIDAFTGLLNVINGFLGILPEFARSIAAIGVAIAGFIGVSKLLNSTLTTTAGILFAANTGGKTCKDRHKIR
jgi:TP901 family phage tail tape measure protein